MSFYCVSDVHGRYDLFSLMLKQINFNESDMLFILGDVVDRGPDGIKMIQWIMDHTENARMLLGNHEWMMLNSLGYPYDKDYDCDKADLYNWMKNGGKPTLDAFNALTHEDQLNIVHFLQNLPLNMMINVHGKDHLMCHAGAEIVYNIIEKVIPSGIKMSLTNTYYCVWDRGYVDMETVDNIMDIGNITMIIGHTPTFLTTQNMQEYATILRIGNNIINIDCGAPFNFPGRLGCLRLDDLKEFYTHDISCVKKEVVQ